MHALEKALTKVLNGEELTGYLSRILIYMFQEGRVSYEQIENMVKDKTGEVLLLASKWRLILPVKTIRTYSWEDRLFQRSSGDLYEMPNVVKYLVEKAIKTGIWDPGHAIKNIFKDMSEPDWNIMPGLLEKLCNKAEYHRITALQIKEVSSGFGLGGKIDVFIAELKASGVISPKLGSITEVLHSGSPIYEINPSLCVKRTVNYGFICNNSISWRFV